MNNDNRKRILNPEDISDFDLTAVSGGRFKEDDIDRINILHNYFLERYPDKAAGIDQIFSMIENDPNEFSYSEVLNMVASLIIH